MANPESSSSQTRNCTTGWFLLTFHARLALAISITLFAGGQVRTCVFRISPSTVLSNSRSGVTLTCNASVLESGVAAAEQTLLSTRQFHADDNGLFLGSVNQQFIPTFYIPGLHIIGGGWGVSEQGEVAFEWADRTSTAFVVYHYLMLTIAGLVNLLIFGYTRRRTGSTEMTT